MPNCDSWAPSTSTSSTDVIWEGWVYTIAANRLPAYIKHGPRASIFKTFESNKNSRLVNFASKFDHQYFQMPFVRREWLVLTETHLRFSATRCLGAGSPPRLVPLQSIATMREGEGLLPLRSVDAKPSPVDSSLTSIPVLLPSPTRDRRGTRALNATGANTEYLCSSAATIDRCVKGGEISPAFKFSAAFFILLRTSSFGPIISECLRKDHKESGLSTSEMEILIDWSAIPLKASSLVGSESGHWRTSRVRMMGTHWRRRGEGRSQNRVVSCHPFLYPITDFSDPSESVLGEKLQLTSNGSDIVMVFPNSEKRDVLLHLINSAAVQDAGYHFSRVLALLSHCSVVARTIRLEGAGLLDAGVLTEHFCPNEEEEEAMPQLASSGANTSLGSSDNDRYQDILEAVRSYEADVSSPVPESSWYFPVLTQKDVEDADKQVGVTNRSLTILGRLPMTIQGRNGRSDSGYSPAIGKHVWSHFKDNGVRALMSRGNRPPSLPHACQRGSSRLSQALYGVHSEGFSSSSIDSLIMDGYRKRNDVNRQILIFGDEGGLPPHHSAIKEPQAVWSQQSPPEGAVIKLSPFSSPIHLPFLLADKPVVFSVIREPRLTETVLFTPVGFPNGRSTENKQRLVVYTDDIKMLQSTLLANWLHLVFHVAKTVKSMQKGIKTTLLSRLVSAIPCSQAYQNKPEGRLGVIADFFDMLPAFEGHVIANISNHDLQQLDVDTAKQLKYFHAELWQMQSEFIAVGLGYKAKATISSSNEIGSSADEDNTDDQRIANEEEHSPTRDLPRVMVSQPGGVDGSTPAQRASNWMEYPPVATGSASSAFLSQMEGGCMPSESNSTTVWSPQEYMLQALSRECSICLQQLAASDYLTAFPICCHVFHLTCLQRWVYHYALGRDQFDRPTQSIRILRTPYDRRRSVSKENLFFSLVNASRWEWNEEQGESSYNQAGSDIIEDLSIRCPMCQTAVPLTFKR